MIPSWRNVYQQCDIDAVAEYKTQKYKGSNISKKYKIESFVRNRLRRVFEISSYSNLYTLLLNRRLNTKGNVYFIEEHGIVYNIPQEREGMS